ncbi:hypothetical protein [uncultured Gemmiger sp.]|uniref:hypothetical protein n=1 Tax=uncultured Gemmiger sp. TaxID=1623490 RepID=UPI00265FAD43|nr:hypothetical protein [uncultured Gemmiger sp.]
MKKQFSKIFAVALSVAALAVSVPVSAFAKSSKPLSYLYTYQLTFDGYDTMSLSPDDSGTITAPALPEGAQYWQCNGKHVMPGEQFSYDQLDDWLCPSVDIDDGTGTHRTTGAYFMAITGDTAYVHYYADDTAVKTDAVFDGGVSEVPSTVNGKAVAYWATADGGFSIYTPATLSYDELFWHIHVEEMGNNLNLYAVFGDGSTPAPAPQPVVTETPAASTEDNTPAVDTRTEQQKEIDEAIANGTWGIEYTTCQKCGYHNWTRQGNVYVCDTCGNTTTTVVGPKGVKGYVGSGAIAAVAPKASAPETRYATAAEAQAAADKREAAYAAAVAAFQKQIDAQNAAYLAALGK